MINVIPQELIRHIRLCSEYLGGGIAIRTQMVHRKCTTNTDHVYSFTHDNIVMIKEYSTTWVLWREEL